MKCPYCGSNNIAYWSFKINLKKVYRCYACEKNFEERDVKDCGKQTFQYGDNFPNFKIERDKFKDLGLVPKAKKDDLVDLWIDFWLLLKDKTEKK